MSHAGIGRFHMRKFILIAAMAVVSATPVQAGDSRSLSVAGMDEKVPAALGKAAGAPKIVEAPKPPEARLETAAPVETAKPVEAPKAAETPQFVARPAAVGKKAEPSKTNSNKDGQVTFEDKKPVAAQDRPLSRRSLQPKPRTSPRSRTRLSRRPPKPRSRGANDRSTGTKRHHARTPPLRRHGRRLGRMVRGRNEKSPRR